MLKRNFSFKILNFNLGFNSYCACLQSLIKSLSGGAVHAPVQQAYASFHFTFSIQTNAGLHGPFCKKKQVSKYVSGLHLK